MGLSRYKENSTQLPYTTLLYGNGPGNQRPRADPTVAPNSTDSPYYVQYAAIYQEEAFHDGSDVAIFASGPYTHLFQGVQEQSYIAHVFAYAMCIGDYAGLAHCRSQPQNDLNNSDQNTDASSPANTVLGSASDNTRNPHRLDDKFLQLQPASSAIGASLPLAALAAHLAVSALLFLTSERRHWKW